MAIFRRMPPNSSPPGGTDAGNSGRSAPGGAPSRPAPASASAKSADTGRAAPEPLSVVLPAVAALGAIASIAAVAWLAQDRPADRPKVKRRCDMILKDLETSCLGIAEIMRRVIRQSPMFGLLGTAGTSPMKFGLLGARIDPSQAQIYVQLVNDVATMLVLATQASFDVVGAIEDGDISPPEPLLYKFGEAQERLTGLLANRSNLKVTAGTVLEVAEKLVALVRDLKLHKAA